MEKAAVKGNGGEDVEEGATGGELEVLHVAQRLGAGTQLLDLQPHAFVDGHFLAGEEDEDGGDAKICDDGEDDKKLGEVQRSAGECSIPHPDSS